MAHYCKHPLRKRVLLVVWSLINLVQDGSSETPSQSYMIRGICYKKCERYPISMYVPVTLVFLQYVYIGGTWGMNIPGCPERKLSPPLPEVFLEHMTRSRARSLVKMAQCLGLPLTTRSRHRVKDAPNRYQVITNDDDVLSRSSVNRQRGRAADRWTGC
jgi:hypothetical protein